MQSDSETSIGVLAWLDYPKIMGGLRLLHSFNLVIMSQYLIYNRCIVLIYIISDGYEFKGVPILPRNRGGSTVSDKNKDS